ncbi:MAG: restriction endonuclease subunit S [Nostoc sp. EkiNYC01]|nr:restriction endonuclease subunit S [Nostoc sp. EkiNYC01]
MIILEGYKQTEVGVIPSDWEVVLLDSVAKRGSGHTPDKKHPEYWNGEIKWISLKDSNLLDNLYIEDTAEKITPAGIANSSAVLHPSGSVVLSRDAGVGKSAITKDVMAVSQHFMAWHCSSQLNNHFLYYWLQAKKSEFERIAIGNTIKTIGLSYFKQLKIPFPPLAEQKAIAQSLSDVDALITALDQLITKKRNIKQGTIQQLLTGKKRLPGFSGEWEIVRVSDITISHKQGFYTNQQYVDDGTYLVRITDLLNPKIDYSNMPKLNILRREFEFFKIETGDFLFARSGAIGRYGIVYEAENAIFGSYIIRFVFNLNRIVNEYFGFFYQTEEVIKQLSAITQGSSNININADNIKSIKVPIPPLPEQKAIVQILSDMDTEIEGLEQKRDKYKAIKQGMMQELLTGKTRLL